MRAIVVVAIVFNVLTLSSTAARSEDNPAELREETAKLRVELQEAQAKIASLEAKVKQLRQKLAENAESKKTRSQFDPFNVGTTFSGSRFYRQKGANPKSEQLWTLTVSERDEGRFKGHIQFKSMDGRRQKVEVSGVAPPNGRGNIRFKTVNGGTFQQEFLGTTVDGQRLALKFRGTGIRGDRVFGDANLERN
jgi:hypothetical protein